jgi:hypothetical protein
VPGISAWDNELTGPWWSWARVDENLQRAPEFIRPLIRGEVKRVEATPEQIAEATEWAGSIETWAAIPEGSKPLHVYDP